MGRSQYNQEFINMKKTILGLTLLLVGLSVQAEKVQLIAKDGFKLYGDYTAASHDSKKGVLMLHQCNADRSMYDQLAQALSAENINSMSLDFRAYGESVTPEVSLVALRKKATDRDNYRQLVQNLKLNKTRTGDVELAYQYFIKKIGSDANIAIIGASCGGTQALNVAQNHNVSRLVLFSSGQDAKYSKLFNDLSDIPTLLIAAQDDEYTFKSANALFRDAKSNQTRLLAYKGDGHGTPLFKLDPQLKNTMVEWFKLN